MKSFAIVLGVFAVAVACGEDDAGSGSPGGSSGDAAASGGSGGSAAGGGSAGSAGADSSGGSGAAGSGGAAGCVVPDAGSFPPGDCQEMYDRSAAACPAEPWGPVAECEKLAIELESIGCAAFAAWLSCASSGTYTCDEGFVDCWDHWGAMDSCRSELAGRGCTRVVDRDSECTGPAAYAFECSADPPATGCVPLSGDGAASASCCPKLALGCD
jgi:hypothetical protein